MIESPSGRNITLLLLPCQPSHFGLANTQNLFYPLAIFNPILRSVSFVSKEPQILTIHPRHASVGSNGFPLLMMFERPIFPSYAKCTQPCIHL